MIQPDGQLYDLKLIMAAFSCCMCERLCKLAANVLNNREIKSWLWHAWLLKLCACSFPCLKGQGATLMPCRAGSFIQLAQHFCDATQLWPEWLLWLGYGGGIFYRRCMPLAALRFGVCYCTCSCLESEFVNCKSQGL